MNTEENDDLVECSPSDFLKALTADSRQRAAELEKLKFPAQIQREDGQELSSAKAWSLPGCTGFLFQWDRTNPPGDTPNNGDIALMSSPQYGVLRVKVRFCNGLDHIHLDPVE